MSYRKPVIGLSLFLVLALVVTWMVFVTLGRLVSGPTNSYSAMFTDVFGLHPGDDVRVAGVRVGRVEDVDLEGTIAKVSFQVQKDQVLHTNTLASVTYQNIIGQRYLGLSPGPGANQTPLKDGSQIPVGHTQASFDIGYLFNGFEPLFTLLDPKQVDNLTEGIIQALQGDSGSVLTLITQTSALAERFAGPDQLVGQVITALNDTLTNLAVQNASLQTVISRTRDALVTLGSRRPELVASVGSINHTLTRLATITDSVYPELEGLIQREPGFTGHLAGDGRARFGYLASNLPYVLKGVARMSQSGSYADIYACNINVSIFAFLGRLIPSVVEHATPGGAAKQSPVCR